MINRWVEPSVATRQTETRRKQEISQFARIVHVLTRSIYIFANESEQTSRKIDVTRKSKKISYDRYIRNETRASPSPSICHVSRHRIVVCVLTAFHDRNGVLKRPPESSRACSLASWHPRSRRHTRVAQIIVQPPK